MRSRARDSAGASSREVATPSSWDDGLGSADGAPEGALLICRSGGPLQRLVDLSQERFGGKRLREERHRKIWRLESRQQLGWMGGHVEHSLVGSVLQQPFHELGAIEPGHDDIDEHEVDGPGHTEQIECFDPVLGLEGAVASFAEQTLGETANHALIIHDQHGSHREGSRVAHLYRYMLRRCADIYKWHHSKPMSDNSLLCDLAVRPAVTTDLAPKMRRHSPGGYSVLGDPEIYSCPICGSGTLHLGEIR